MVITMGKGVMLPRDVILPEGGLHFMVRFTCDHTYTDVVLP